MTVEQYLRGLREVINQFEREVDKGRQMSLADVGRLFPMMQSYSAQHREMPILPYDAESEKI